MSAFGTSHPGQNKAPTLLLGPSDARQKRKEGPKSAKQPASQKPQQGQSTSKPHQGHTKTANSNGKQSMKQANAQGGQKKTAGSSTNKAPGTMNKVRSSQNPQSAFGKPNPKRVNGRPTEKPKRKVTSKQHPVGFSANGEISSMDVDSESAPYAPINKTLQSTGPLPQFQPQESTAVGPIFADPSQFGFMQRHSKPRPRPAPRYMFTQPRLLLTLEFRQDPWDKENQEKMLRIEEANQGNDFQGIYEEFQKMRDVERKKMEDLGLVDAENITKDLNDAIFFQGTCLDMCPTFERVRRSLENNVKALEKDPSTQKIARSRAIKAFSRPAAGQPPPMPSDVRPPHILKQTLDYLTNNILPQLPEAHSFIWDRTRSIRQDFIYQNYYGPEAIDCNERIVRIHLLSLHVMAGSDVEYSQQQELEQFNKALQTLTEIYQDVRFRGGQCPNEAEFRAYHLISHFRDPELEREVQTLPDEIYQHPNVQLALRFRTLMSQNNLVDRGHSNVLGALNLFVEFFRLVFDKQTPLLLAFLVETHFNEIRFYALKSLSRSYHTKGKAFVGGVLQQMLGFDTLQDLQAFLSYYEVDTFVEDGTVLVDLCNKAKLESKYKLNSLSDKPKRLPPCSSLLTQRLELSATQNLINSGLPNDNLNIRRTPLEQILENTTRKPIEKSNKPSQLFQSQPPSTNNPLAGAGSHAVSLKERLSQLRSQVQQSKMNSATPSNAVPELSQTPKTNSVFGQPQQSQPHIAPVSGVDNLPKKEATSAFGFGSTPGQTSTQTPAPSFSIPTFASSTFDEEKNKEKKKEKEQEAVTKNSPKTSITSSATQSNVFKTSIGAPKQDSAFKMPTFSAQTKSFKEPTLGSTQAPAQAPAQFPAQFPAQTPAQSTTSLFKSGPAKPHQSLDDKSTSKPLFSTASLLSKQSTPQFLMAKSSPTNSSRIAEEALKSVLDTVISEELTRTLQKLVANRERDVQRDHFISGLTDELYSAFMSEIIHHSVAQSLATETYDRALKRKCILRLQQRCRLALLNQKAQQERLLELRNIDFSSSPIKRSREVEQAESTQSLKKPRTLVAKATDFALRQTEIQKLWEPLNLHQFLEKCLENCTIRERNDTVKLRCLILAENWRSPYAKWLSTKFELSVSPDKTHYVNSVANEKLLVTFQSLPKSQSLDAAMFTDTPFIVFEFGLSDEKQTETYKTLRQKLTRDLAILGKIMQICSRYCYYRIHVLILVWDVTESQATDEVLAEIIQPHQLVSTYKAVKSVEICNFSSNTKSVSEAMEDHLMVMAQAFDGALTARGQQKRAASSTKQISGPEALAAQKLAAEQSLKMKESQLLKRGEELSRRSYLNRLANRTLDSINTTGAFKTPNGSFAGNQSLMNYNHLFLGNVSMPFSRDNSFMRAFGNVSGFEESTPHGSRRASVLRAPVPKKVQDLRDLTASIKAKYKRDAEQ